MSATSDFAIPGQQQPREAAAVMPTGARHRHEKSADESTVNLPPGFRFHPTDEELVVHYLGNKAINPEFTASAMGDVDLNQFEPWELPAQVKMVGGKQQNMELYLFNQRDRKYPTGTRTNRATRHGYWKATGRDKVVFTRVGNKKLVVGLKKTLVYYRGRAPKGIKSNWVIHEYRLDMAGGDPERSYWAFITQGHPEKLHDEWVVCRVLYRPGNSRKPVSSAVKREETDLVDDAHYDQLSAGEPTADEPPPLVEPSYTDSRDTAAAGDTVANSFDIKSPVADVANHIYVSFANNTQIQMTTMMMSGDDGPAQFKNPIPNSTQPVLFGPHFSFEPFAPMNPMLPLDDNLIYGLNTINDCGAADAFVNARPLHHQTVVPQMKMIPTPWTPANQFNTEHLPASSPALQIFSPDSAGTSGVIGSCSYISASPGGSSVHQMRSGGGGSVFMDNSADDDQFSFGSQFMTSAAPNNSWRQLR